MASLDRWANGEGPKPFWKTRAYDFNITAEDTFHKKLDYIHKNPVTRGLVDRAEQWRWSSYRDYEIDDRSPLAMDWDGAWPIEWRTVDRMTNRPPPFAARRMGHPSPQTERPLGQREAQVPGAPSFSTEKGGGHSSSRMFIVDLFITVVLPSPTLRCAKNGAPLTPATRSLGQRDRKGSLRGGFLPQN